MIPHDMSLYYVLNVSSLTGVVFLLLVLAFFTTMFTILAVQPSSPLTASTLEEEDSSSSSASSDCIIYDPKEKMITVSCKSANLTDINNQVKDPDILDKEHDNNSVWVLNAGIVGI